LDSGGGAPSGLTAELGGNRFTPVPGQRTRDAVITLASHQQSAKYRLIALMIDRKDSGASAQTFMMKQVVVQDKNEPVLVVTTGENTVPSLDAGNTFAIDGYTLDDTGVKTLRIAWLPEALQTEAGVIGAEAALASSTLADGKETLANGITIWAPALVTGQDQGAYKKQIFTQVFNIFEDFKYNGQTENKDKRFVIYAADESHKVFTSFGVLKYSGLPVITLVRGGDSQHDAENDLVIEFNAVSAYPSVEMDTGSYKIEDVTNTPRTLADGLTTATVPKNELGDNDTKTYRITAADKSGNVAEKEFSVLMSALPGLVSITAADADGAYKTGQTLTFHASFSKAVKVAGAPKLKLYQNTGLSGTPYYADYTAGSGSGTLTFTYTVKSGDAASKLSTPLSSPVEDGSITGVSGPGAALQTAVAPLQTKSSLALDGTRPRITGMTVSSGIFNEGKSVTFTAAFSEPVQISGQPSLILDSITGNTGGYAAKFYRSPNTAAAEFRYTVQAGDTSAAAGIAAPCISVPDAELITDSAGNPLDVISVSLAGTAKIDTTAPAAPVLNIADSNGANQSPLASDQFYNSAKRLALSGFSTDYAGNSVTYSTDGGVTWRVYTNYADLPADAAYQLTAKYKDTAGNESPAAAVRTVTISAGLSFSSITGTTVDGSYKYGATLRFKVALSDSAGVDNAANVKITIGGTQSGDTGGVVLSLAASPAPPTPAARSAVLYFDYAIPDDTITRMRDIAVSAVDFSGASDRYGNTGPANLATPYSLGRAGLVVDNAAPAITGYSPVIDGTVPDVSGKHTITLTFAENVFAESGGYITIKPWGAAGAGDSTHSGGNWPVPPVIGSATWANIYAALSEEDRKVLLYLDGNDYPLAGSPGSYPNAAGSSYLNSSAYPVTAEQKNFYRKTTQGFITATENAVPDAATKYVLDFRFGLYGDDTDKVRSVLEKAKYLWQEIDVTSNSVKISNNVVTITLPENLAAGRQFELLVSANAVRDAAGNFAAALNGNTYHFRASGVAKPYIRVNRASYRGANPQSAANQEDPFIDVPVRIDCETPEAVITYGVLAGGNASKAWSDTAGNANISQVTQNQLTGITANTAYTAGGFFYAGDGNGSTGSGDFFKPASYSDSDARFRTVRKDYVKAAAAYAGSTAYDYEGVFKTVVMLHHLRRASANTPVANRFRIYGADDPELSTKKPVTAGFPFHGVTYLFEEYGADMFRIQDGGEFNYLWLSWEVVTDWTFGGRGYRDDELTGQAGNNLNPLSNPFSYGSITIKKDARTFS
jgi:hypothetical protein